MVSGLQRLKDTLGRPNMASVFETWRSQPFTQIIASAVMDLILNQPSSPGMTVDSCAVQYGVTQGLTLAYQLMQDPSVVVPGVFSHGAENQPVETFDTAPDEELT